MKESRPSPVDTLTNRRQPAYDAVFAYIRSRPRDFLPRTIVERNAIIWRAVHAALDAMKEHADAHTRSIIDPLRRFAEQLDDADREDLLELIRAPRAEPTGGFAAAREAVRQARGHEAAPQVPILFAGQDLGEELDCTCTYGSRCEQCRPDDDQVLTETAASVPLDVQVRQAHTDALEMMLPSAEGDGCLSEAALQTMAHARLNIYRRAAEAHATAGLEQRIRELHRPVAHRGGPICAECSAADAGTDSTDNSPVAYDQCATLAALNPPKEA